MLIFFFFQAEDGIRDVAVTGVQTCALPISPQLKDWAQNGWLNIGGGCCGTTPAHIKAIADAVRGIAPRRVPAVEPHLRLSGLDAVTIRRIRPLEKGSAGASPAAVGAPADGSAVGDTTPGSEASREPRETALEASALPVATFVNIGERTNVAGSPKFAQLIKGGDF